MQHISQITTDMLKRQLPAERYYNDNLDGSFGKATGNAWHMWNGLCPFHDDRSAGSFVVNRDTGAFRCFSCNNGGNDIIDFYMQKEHLNFKEALQQLWRIAICKK